MSSTLQDLRKEAGFRTAKDFAEAVGIPAPTYTRYEQDPLKIPIDRAWKIADELHCSIDAVVGREHIDVADMRGDFQKFIETFSADDQRLMWAIASAVSERATIRKREHESDEEHKYDQYVAYYERLLNQEADGDSEMTDTLIFGSPEQRRSLFKMFLTKRAEEKRQSDVDQEVTFAMFDFAKGIPVEDEDGNVADLILPDDERYEGEMDTMEKTMRSTLAEEYEERDRATIKKLMDAYDRRHPRRSSFSEAVRNVRNHLAHFGGQDLSEADRATLEQGAAIAEAILSRSAKLTPPVPSSENQQ